MVTRRNLKHSLEVRERIQTSQLINRLQDCGNGKTELSSSQLKAIEILLRKSLPDLAAVQISGDPEKPLGLAIKWIS